MTSSICFLGCQFSAKVTRQGNKYEYDSYFKKRAERWFEALRCETMQTNLPKTSINTRKEPEETVFRGCVIILLVNDINYKKETKNIF